MLSRDHGVRSQRGNRDQRIHASQTWRQPEQIQRLGQPACVSCVSVYLETKHTASAMHLLHCQRTLWMAFEKRIMRAPYLGMSVQELRNSQRVLVVTLNAYRKRSDTEIGRASCRERV